MMPNTFVGRLEFDPTQRYDGRLLNELFKGLLVAWWPGELRDDLLAELPGVELRQRVIEHPAPTTSPANLHVIDGGRK